MRLSHLEKAEVTEDNLKTLLQLQPNLRDNLRSPESKELSFFSGVAVKTLPITDLK